jgi:hypothetical protein
MIVAIKNKNIRFQGQGVPSPQLTLVKSALHQPSEHDWYRRMALLDGSCDIHHRRMSLSLWLVMLPPPLQLTQEIDDSAILSTLLYRLCPKLQNGKPRLQSELTLVDDVFLHDAATGLMENSLHIIPTSG